MVKGMTMKRAEIEQDAQHLASANHSRSMVRVESPNSQPTSGTPELESRTPGAPPGITLPIVPLEVMIVLTITIMLMNDQT